MNTTRTLGQLHFEDLEPKRFEDLVRQLVYEFRAWRKLEATGRGGDDDGFDARGWEIVVTSDSEGEDEPDEAAPGLPDDRQWLIQCKRERAIGPKKLEAYAQDFKIEADAVLYGIIFAAACDFSKQAHDVFNTASRNLGIEEFYLWGKGELEDQLFQPRNDHLLFAYFGISLTIRRRTLQSNIRRDVAIKRRLKTSIAKCSDYDKILAIRNAAGDMYPELRASDKLMAEDQWRFCEFVEFEPRGLVVECGKFFAFIDGEKWDAADGVAYRASELPVQWKLRARRVRQTMFESVRHIWNAFDDQHKAWLTVQWVIPYDRILAVDDIGDAFFEEGPHVYCTYVNGRPCDSAYATVAPTNYIGQSINVGVDGPNRILKFPAEMRNPGASCAT